MATFRMTSRMVGVFLGRGFLAIRQVTCSWSSCRLIRQSGGLPKRSTTVIYMGIFCRLFKRT